MRFALLLLTLPLLAGQVRAEPPAGEQPKFAGKPLQFWLDELKSTNALSREEALAVLEQAGPVAKEGIPQVEKLLTDDRPTVRRQAAFTLARIGGAKKPAAEALAKDLETKDHLARVKAL